MCARELANRIEESTKPGHVIVSTVNPGLVNTQIARNLGYWYGKFLSIVFMLVARTPEEGSRTIVLAAEGGEKTHGQYLNDGQVGVPSDFVTSEEGLRVQKQLWVELMLKLDAIYPGIADVI
ncbi:hypothetical protein CCHL11_03561 [Colletotrichum chlorophyti]|uniref:Uncharacterized protein n=1 Tax=Colletotrichum chlorophyti TaxID=708187 RepID=A0A1Q8RSE9_9PEZI|nr:hypothetical protein CCHL11_03561 [Colletotrichum chlorophyti]